MCTFDISTLYHTCACFVISMIVGIILYFAFNISIIPAATAGVIAAFLCGLGKEYADHLSPINYWNWGDIIGNFIGCAIAFVILILIF